MNYTFQQSYEQNMIWHYSISMKAVALKPKELGMSTANFLNSVAANTISNGITKLISDIAGDTMSSVSNGINSLGLNVIGI